MGDGVSDDAPRPCIPVSCSPEEEVVVGKVHRVEFTMQGHRFVIIGVVTEGVILVEVIERPRDGMPVGLRFEISTAYVLEHASHIEVDP